MPARVLFAVIVYELIWIATVVFPFDSKSAVIFLLEGIPLPVALFAAPILVYKDASKINRTKGFKALNATLWSILLFLIGYVALPWYAFVSRKKAILIERKQVQ